MFVLKHSYELIIFFVLLSLSCLGQSGKSKNNYYEDLNCLRPKISNSIDSSLAVIDITLHAPKRDIQPIHNVNSFLDPLLDSINRFNMTRKFCDGFSIQIYSGLDRVKAIRAKEQLDTSEFNMNVTLKYEQPKFHVRSGSYFSRLEAQKSLLQLKRIFPNAILVPSIIMLH